MEGFKAFLKRKDIEISVKRYLIDALGAMAQGLFCSLLIGTIINTVGSQFHIGALTTTVATIGGVDYTVGGLATAMSGPAMAVAIGYALKCPPLVLFSLITVGFASNALGGAGGPLAVLFIAIIAAEIGKMVSKETRVDILVTPLGRPSRFSHKREKATPGYYEVYLTDTNVLAKLSAGQRCALHEYTFDDDSGSIVINLRHRDSLDDWELHVEGNRCYGHRTSTSWARGQKVCFYMEFSEPPSSFSLTPEGDIATLNFRGRKITLRAGISSVSSVNARKNLYSDYPRSLSALRKATAAAWEACLGKVPCPYGDAEKRACFYTALYHTAIHPTLYSDCNGEYRGMDGKVHRADGWNRYTVFSLWDTFRGLHPLLMDTEPERSVDFIRSMLSIYDEAGKLPVWELSGYETNCMIGYNSAPVIADAILRGLEGFDYEKAFEALVSSARREDFGLGSFRRNGLVLADDEHESVSKTLEYAFDDWCVAQVALKLGHMKEYEEFATSAQYWKNVLDPETRFMRARLNGRWIQPFDPREVNNHYTEANSWQYSFYVPHDIPALIEALGGADGFERRLDALFAAPSKTTGRTQADITGQIGQYAHGNEPSHHIAFLYDAVGRADKRQARVEEILQTLYSSKPDGLSGNDDCGQMSAWYVLASLGRYPAR